MFDKNIEYMWLLQTFPIDHWGNWERLSLMRESFIRGDLGKTFETTMRSLKKLQKEVDWLLLNGLVRFSKHFDISQGFRDHKIYVYYYSSSPWIGFKVDNNGLCYAIGKDITHMPDSEYENKWEILERIAIK